MIVALKHQKRSAFHLQRNEEANKWLTGELCAVLNNIVSHYVLYYTVLYCTILYCTVLYYTAEYCTVLYCTVLYYTALHYNILNCTALHRNVPCPCSSCRRLVCPLCRCCSGSTQDCCNPHSFCRISYTDWSEEERGGGEVEEGWGRERM